MKKKAKKIQKKEETAEDWCFVCKDGGLLLVCEYKQCLKSYHPDCVGKDESFSETGSRWTCDWHSCFNCHKYSKFYCYCCPNAVCQRCINVAEFARVRGNKGLCSNCLKLALLVEEKMDVDSDGETIDFKDRNTYECLFMEYWDIIKVEESLTLEDLVAADARLKKGHNYKSGANANSDGSDEDVECHMLSGSDDGDDINELKSWRKGKRSKGSMNRNVKSTKNEYIGWGSKSLIQFLESIGKDVNEKLSQHEVTTIINRYINENKLLDPENKRKVICDGKLKPVLGRKKVNRNRIHDILDPHFAENLQLSEEDELEYYSEEKDENVFVACKKQRKQSSDVKCQKKEIVSKVPRTIFAATVAENIKLVYLKRSLLQELLKQPETFENKVMGSFVRVKSGPNDYFRGNAFHLVQVTGIKRTSNGENNTEILLQISNVTEDIPISMLSDDDFSKEECEDLRQKVRRGLLKRPTLVELEQKATSLHEDITKHRIIRELALLQNLIDRANEKGWRNELFQYMERRRLLQTPSERERLLQTVPKVIADETDLDPIPKETIENGKHGDVLSPKSILMGSLETHGDNSEVNQAPLEKEENPCHVSVPEEKQTEDFKQETKRDQEELAVQLIELNSEDDSDFSSVPKENKKLEDREYSEWHCLGPNGESKGPYSLSFLKRWNETSPLASKFKVWKTSQSQDDAISLTDAILLLSPDK